MQPPVDRPAAKLAALSRDGKKEEGERETGQEIKQKLLDKNDATSEARLNIALDVQSGGDSH